MAGAAECWQEAARAAGLGAEGQRVCEEEEQRMCVEQLHLRMAAAAQPAAVAAEEGALGRQWPCSPDWSSCVRAAAVCEECEIEDMAEIPEWQGSMQRALAATK